ncbi:hypothetical protein BYT27DRAFT_6861458 [Phlegmacium glaucopus]|nr:hypothetical protein BYT27DRAFT_6861458 [Phlegmacium glaucopus]
MKLSYFTSVFTMIIASHQVAAVSVPCTIDTDCSRVTCTGKLCEASICLGGICSTPRCVGVTQDCP